MWIRKSLTDLLLLGYSCILAGWVGGGGGGGGEGEGKGSFGWSCQNKGILKISKTKRKDISKYQKGTLALALLAPTPFQYAERCVIWNDAVLRYSGTEVYDNDICS